MTDIDTVTPDDAFALLANETRLRVIEAIGERSGGGEYAALSYGTLRDAVGIEDTGNLNYHLRKLRDRFVEKDGDRYRLTIPGIRVYQAVLSGSFEARQLTVAPVETDISCEDCSGRLHVSYEDNRFFMRCLSCETTYTRYPLSPNAFDPDDPESLVTAAARRSHGDLRLMIGGVCPYCSGEVRRELSTEDRGGMGVERYDVFAHLECSACHWFSHPSLEGVAYQLPSMQVFFDERGVPTDPVPFAVDGEMRTHVRSRDPWRVEVRTTLAGDSIRHVFDGDLRVVEWEVLEGVSLV